MPKPTPFFGPGWGGPEKKKGAFLLFPGGAPERAPFFGRGFPLPFWLNFFKVPRGPPGPGGMARPAPREKPGGPGTSPFWGPGVPEGAPGALGVASPQASGRVLRGPIQNRASHDLFPGPRLPPGAEGGPPGPRVGLLFPGF